MSEVAGWSADRASVDDARRHAQEAARIGDFAAAARWLSALAADAGAGQEVLNELGVALAKAGRAPEALDAFERAADAGPGSDLARLNLGMLAHDLGRFARACRAFDGIGTPPRAWPVEARIAFAMSLARRGRCDAACLQVMSLLSDGAATLSVAQIGAVSDVLGACGRDEDAMSLLRMALQDAFADPGPHLRLAACLARAGRHEEAGRESAWRWRARGLPDGGRRDLPPWLGERSLDGRRLLLHADGDLASTVRDLGLLAAVRARGAIVTLTGPSAIVDALDGAGPTWTADPDPADHDFHCPLGSLHALLRQPLPALAPGRPYLSGTPRSGEGDIVVLDADPAGRPDETMQALAEALAGGDGPVRIEPAAAGVPGDCRLLVARDGAPAELAAATGLATVVLVDPDAPWHWLPAGPSAWYGPHAVSIPRDGPPDAWLPRALRAISTGAGAWNR